LKLKEKADRKRALERRLHGGEEEEEATATAEAGGV
jgi:hypothetical protein